MYAVKRDEMLDITLQNDFNYYDEIKVSPKYPTDQSLKKANDVVHMGEVKVGDKVFPCAIGERGVTDHKQEGDLKTPLGRYHLRRLYYRYDKLQQPIYSQMPLMALLEDDGWCDEEGDPSYNQPVMLPYHASAERLWREDDLYDIIIVLGYNDDPVEQGKGSAIFMHVAREDDVSQSFKATKGCVALKKEHLLELLPYLSEQTIMEITTH